MSDIIKKLEILYKELSRIRAEIVFLESQNKDVNDMIFNYIVKIVCEKENILYIKNTKHPLYIFIFHI